MCQQDFVQLPMRSLVIRSATLPVQVDKSGSVVQNAFSFPVFIGFRFGDVPDESMLRHCCPDEYPLHRAHRLVHVSCMRILWEKYVGRGRMPDSHSNEPGF